MAEQAPIINWIEEEVKSTLKEGERQHIWNSFEQARQDIYNELSLLKTIVQNPMVISEEDLNIFIEVSTRFSKQMKQTDDFLTATAKYINEKISQQRR